MYTHFHIKLLSISHYDEWFEALKTQNIEVLVFLLFAVAFFLAVVIFMLAIYIRRGVRLKKNQKIKDYQFKYQMLIYEALIESQENKTPKSISAIANKFRSYGVKSQLSQQALIDLMLSLKKSFSGQFETQINQIYRELALYDVSLRKVKKGSWSEKSQGIRELAAMNYHEAWLEVAKLRQSRNNVLAQEAQMASILLADGKPLYFLDNYTKPISYWQQINFYKYLLKVDKSLLPDFQRWLLSENESVLIFSLKMISIFNQANAASAVADLLNHSSLQVKSQAIQTLTKLEAGAYVNHFFRMLDTYDTNIRVAAIEALGKLGSEYHKRQLKPFLLDNSYPVRLAAARALKGISIKYDEQLDTEAKHRQEEILNHVADPML